MNRREERRIAMDHEMLIYRCGLPVGTGRIRDASRRGVFVETDCMELRAYQPLEFEFCQTDQQAGVRHHRLGARVLRREPAGVALEVDKHDPRADAAMSCLLNRPQVAV